MSEKMKTNLQIDRIDKNILKLLLDNARISFLNIARSCNVSGAAIHQRIQKLKEKKIINGYHCSLNPKSLGYYTCAFIGLQINLTSTSSHEDIFNRIKEIPEIVECHHVTGKYSLLIKIYSKNNEHLKQLIIDKIQSIYEITNTETFLSLEEGFTRHLPID